ncbi:MAG: hypothetical protein MI976_04610 [Pseudomonadales bacterium]|nr:hypothetical protein [Pseudomonadales bacterium]
MDRPFIYTVIGLWTENTGHRTPIGEYGKFWVDKKEEAKLDQNLLDELL